MEIGRKTWTISSFNINIDQLITYGISPKQKIIFILVKQSRLKVGTKFWKFKHFQQKYVSIFPEWFSDDCKSALVRFCGCMFLALANVTEPKSRQPHVPIFLQHKLKGLKTIILIKGSKLIQRSTEFFMWSFSYLLDLTWFYVQMNNVSFLF